MTEYWKSQARKYCEFCKCWFADNKVSISFHESGKRHKENVQKHISQLTKKSTKDAKKKGKLDDDMKKMEEAAMVAYLQDVQNNADITSQSINELLGKSGSSSSDLTVGSSGISQKKGPPVWQEAKSDDGSSYFWNTDTNETTWDPPDEYVSIVQQEEKKLKEEKKRDKVNKDKQKEVYKEVNACLAREKMKARAVKDDPKPPKYQPSFGPVPYGVKPYGTWTPVVTQPVEKVDLQLPKPDKELPPPPVVMEPERIQFGEKRVQTLGDGPVEFKRRKLNTAKRNIRQKLDDE